MIVLNCLLSAIYRRMLSRLQALGIMKSAFNQVDLTTCSSLWLEDGAPVDDIDIVACSRIGIANAGEWTTKPLRFYVRGNKCVSVRDKKVESEANGS
jgi:DNA-3-methyladenine glycosylase